MSTDSVSTRRQLLIPEVVQTSALDCGPAALKCLLEGFGIHVSYGRLREACQTDIDGTSIDTVEQVAVQLGLAAEQIMLPVDHVLMAAASALPAIVVVRNPAGVTHFVIAWRCQAGFVQVMDPATGRRWPTRQQFLSELYLHTQRVPAAAWREWAGSDDFLNVLRRRLGQLGIRPAAANQLIDTACANPAWRPIAALDAAARMVDSMVRSKGIRPGREALEILKDFFTRASSETPDTHDAIPAAYWSVRSAPVEPDSEEQLFLRGAVLVRARGRRLLEPGQAGAAALSPELVAALQEPPTHPLGELLRYLRADGWLAPAALIAAWALAATGLVIETLLLRGLIDLGQMLGLSEQRFGLVAATLILLAANLLIQFSITTNVLRLGRRLETRLRMAFLTKLPRLSDRYFQSRLISDMAERGHNVHRLRDVPTLGAELLRWVFTLILTTVGLIWLDPGCAPIALLAAAVSLGLPLALQPILAEQDLRVRNHIGALGRFYLDALLGLTAIRTHGAERSVRREHEGLLVEWARARLRFQQVLVGLEGANSLLGFGLAAWLLFDHLARGGGISDVLLLVYWALNLPVIGQELATTIRQYPLHRNIVLRLIEPLGAPEEEAAPEPVSAAAHECHSERSEESLARPATCLAVPEIPHSVRNDTRGVRNDTASRAARIEMRQVSVQAAGHLILETIDLSIAAGSHIAIVGPSGAGKSSLVGLLLGWHRPAAGQIVVDGQPLDAAGLERLRRDTAWVDPAVQLWNRSFSDNVRYGERSDSSVPLSAIIDQADLMRVLERLPDGLQTPLGEGGGLVSGGEGQRVRLGRALLRSKARLVILDEPFRGLDRDQRRELLARARGWWPDSTLLCITHDVSETQTFERVLVMDGGHIIEDGRPADLARQARSRYRAMLDAEVAVRVGLWSSAEWRRLRMENGRLLDASRGDA